MITGRSHQCPAEKANLELHYKNILLNFPYHKHCPQITVIFGLVYFNSSGKIYFDCIPIPIGDLKGKLSQEPPEVGTAVR
jgi:hypothetical protein